MAYYLKDVQCPYCDYEFNVADDGYDDWEWECSECGKMLIITAENSRDYHASKMPAVEQEGEE